MTSVLKAPVEFWDFLIYELTDQRSKGWFLCGSPLPPFLILFVYHQIIKKFGPAYMKNREPFNIDKIIQIYNVIQILLNGWLAFEGFRYTYGPNGSYNWRCEPIDDSMSSIGIKVVTITWGYYMTKIFDLLDTVFFVLRKKFSQATFLHVYHHIGVVILSYVAVKYYPDGHGFLLVPLNSFVHCFMYTYYFLTNYNPEYRKNIWWKKHITQLQIVQFLILFVHVGKVLFIKDCTYPVLPVLLFIPQDMLMLYLFSKFYINAYIKPKPSVKSS